jgi:hypothetical protein
MSQPSKKRCVRADDAPKEPPYSCTYHPFPKKYSFRLIERWEANDADMKAELEGVAVSGDGCYLRDIIQQYPPILIREFHWAAAFYADDDYYLGFFFTDMKKLHDFEKGMYLPWPISPV